MDKYLYEETRLKMAHRAFTLGIWAIALAFIFSVIPYLSIGLGALSIIFAVLSKGYKQRIDRDAKIGVILSSIAITICLATIGSSFYKLATDTEFRKSVFDIAGEFYGSMYGEDFENIEEFYNNLLGGDDSYVDL